MKTFVRKTLQFVSITNWTVLSNLFILYIKPNKTPIKSFISFLPKLNNNSNLNLMDKLVLINEY